jgi:hypothetical protein
MTLPLPRIWFHSALALLLLLRPDAGTAGEPVVQQYRILGLNEPGRVEDLRQAFESTPGVTLENADFDKEEVSIRIQPETGNSKNPLGTDPEALLKRLNQLLGQASRSTFKLAPRSTIPADKLQRVEIPVGLLDCKGCRFGAYRAIAYLEGVERVKVTTQPTTVCAWIDPDKTSRDTLTAALRKARVELPSE